MRGSCGFCKLGIFLGSTHSDVDCQFESQSLSQESFASIFVMVHRICSQFMVLYNRKLRKMSQQALPNKVRLPNKILDANENVFRPKKVVVASNILFGNFTLFGNAC